MLSITMQQIEQTETNQELFYLIEKVAKQCGVDIPNDKNYHEIFQTTCLLTETAKRHYDNLVQLEALLLHANQHQLNKL